MKGQLDGVIVLWQAVDQVCHHLELLDLSSIVE
jgi:hypothetical protein